MVSYSLRNRNIHCAITAAAVCYWGIFTPFPLPTGVHSASSVCVGRCLSCAGMPQQTVLQGHLCLCGVLGLWGGQIHWRHSIKPGVPILAVTRSHLWSSIPCSKSNSNISSLGEFLWEPDLSFWLPWNALGIYHQRWAVTLSWEGTTALNGWLNSLSLCITCFNLINFF